MKYRILPLLLACTLLFCSCGTKTAEPKQLNLVSSFYPVYVTLLNLTEGIPNISVSNLTENTGGCLHDYTLTTADLKKLSHADALFINGAGMEPFMDKVQKNLSTLHVVNLSDKLSLLGENPHVWMSPERYLKQIDMAAESLATIDAEHAGAYYKNAEAYRNKVKEVQARMKQELQPLQGKKLVTFHEAFDYFADEFGLVVASTIQHDEHSAPSPNDIAQTIHLMQTDGIHALFAEPGNASSAISMIAKATGAKVFTLDPVTTPGEEADPDAYLTAMEKNLETLKTAFSS